MRLLILTMVCYLSALPVSALEDGEAVQLRGEILTLPAAPVVGQPADSWRADPRPQTYAEMHPIVSLPATMTWKGMVKAGRMTHTTWIGRAFKKVGLAASDAFVVFGQKTEKYHPGLQTLGYASSIVIPTLLGRRNSK